MKSAYPVTILMGIVALIAAGMAAASYPWPEVVVENAQVDKPLFERYETTSVRGLEVVGFDEDRSEIQRFRLKRNGERWVIPQKSSFDVTGANNVNRVVSALNDCTVLEVNSDSQNDHVNYGVVDPTNVGGNVARSSLGMKLELTDRDRKTIASLIVGNPVKDSQEKKYYVRVPGRPTVYTIAFNKRILGTELRHWADPNLMKLPTDAGSDLRITRILVDRYRIDEATGEKTDLYKLDYGGKSNQLPELLSFTVQGKEGDRTKLPPRLAQSLILGVLQMPLTDVVKQSKSALKLLRSERDVVGSKGEKELEKAGFLYGGYRGLGHQVVGRNGKISLQRSDGVNYHLSVGKLANQVGGDSLSLLYQVMVTADVNLEAFPEPEASDADADADDEQEKKAYLRKVKDRNEKLKLAGQQAAEINRQHRSWIYIVEEEVINRLFPKLTEQ